MALTAEAEAKDESEFDTWGGYGGKVAQYTYTNAFPVGHGEQSCIQILRYMPLTDEEIMAIRWHMGAFDYSFKGGDYGMNNAFNSCKLAAMLNIADMMATPMDEREEKASE